MNDRALIPGQPAPELRVPTIAGATWTLSQRQPENLTMVVFYRGRHCPVCETYLEGLERLIPEFSRAGVDVLAVSCDGEEQARSSWQD